MIKHWVFNQSLNEGYTQQGVATVFSVNVPVAGIYIVALQYVCTSSSTNLTLTVTQKATSCYTDTSPTMTIDEIYACGWTSV